MTDRRGLGIVGLILGGVTASVMMVGTLVVQAHLDGRLKLEDKPRPVAAAVSLPANVP